MLNYPSRVTRYLLGHWFVWAGFLAGLLAGCTLPPPPLIPTYTASPVVNEARSALVDYYQALVQGDYTQAAELLDPEAGLDPQALQALWEQMAVQGWRIVDFQVGEARVYDAERVVFTVTYTQEGDVSEAGPPGTFTVPVVTHRGADGMWRVADGILERRPLFGGPVTRAELGVQPHLWTVGPAGIEVAVRLSNGGDGAITWPADSGECARLRLADGQELRAECPRLLQSIPPGGQTDVTLSFPVDVLDRARPPHPQVLALTGIQGPDGPLGPIRMTLH